MLEDTSLKLVRTSSNDIRRGNMGTHHPSKEKASKSKQITYLDKKHGYDKVTAVTGQFRRQMWTWAWHVSRIRNIHRTSRITTWKQCEGNRSRRRQARRWRDELDDYWEGTIWQRIVHDRQTWKHYNEAFTQPPDTMAAQ